MRKCILLIVIAFSSQSLAGIKSDIEKLINKTDPNINIGIEVLDLNTNKTLYKKNNKRWFTPASNMKIYSDAAALIMLGPDYHFETKLVTDAKSIVNGELKGNLYLIFSGDPSLSHNNLERMITRLQAYGIKKISGDFLLVNPSFKTKPYGPGWMTDDTVYGYGSPVTPLSIDANRVDVIINPATKNQTKAYIEITDPSNSIKLINNVLTQAESKHCKLDYKINNNNVLGISGCVKINSLSVTDTVAIRNPLSYAINLISKLLEQKNIILVGKMKEGRTAKHTKLLYTHRSASLAHLMSLTLKPSDNLYADSLFLKVGELYYNKAASWAKSQLAVKNILRKYAKIRLAKAVIVDGSGLSRYNLISPKQTVQLLKFLHQQFPIAYEFITALPVAGRDGTLQKRLLASNQRDLIRAKTGGMLGIVSLSGYLSTRNNHVLAFSIMINGISGNSHRFLYRYRVLEDKICDYFLKLSPSGSAKHRSGNDRLLLPYEKRNSDVVQQRQKRRTLNNIEFVLKKALQNKQVQLVRKTDQVIIYANNLGLASLIDKTINRLRKQYSFWVELKTHSPKVMQHYELSNGIVNLSESAKNNQWVFHLG